MTVDRLLGLVAGVFILLSLLLSRVHSEYWLLFTAFVGANLLQSFFTNFPEDARGKGPLPDDLTHRTVTYSRPFETIAPVTLFSRPAFFLILKLHRGRPAAALTLPEDRIPLRGC